MWKTRICDLFGIEYPIVQSPMHYVVSSELVAAVSNAGGLGICSSSHNVYREVRDPAERGEQMRTEIREVRKLTNKPIGVNIRARVANPGKKGLDKYSPVELAVMKVAIEEKVPIVYTTLGIPDAFVEHLHKFGIKVMHIGSQVRHAKKAEEVGVDAFICTAYDAGGHSPGHGDTTLFTLLPQVVDAVKIPVLAGCGVADARGLVAAFALGAEGICMGSRFAATHESRIVPKAKEALVKADDTATVAWGKKEGGGLGRTLKTPFTEKYLEMEMNGASAEELKAFHDSYRDPANRGLDRRGGAYFEADLEGGTFFAGAVVGLIKEIKHAKDVVKDIAKDADKVLARLNSERLPARL